MRKIILFILVTLYVFSFNENIYAVDYSCYDNIPGISCTTPWINETKTETFSFAASCTVTVHYKYRECLNTICTPPRYIRQYALGSIDFDESSPLCLTLAQNIFPGYPNNFSVVDQNYLNYMIDQIFLKFQIRDFNTYYLNHPEEQLAMNCLGVPPNCTFPTDDCTSYYSYYTLAKCRALCIYKREIGTSGDGIISITPITCPSLTETLCCKFTKRFCKCGTETLISEFNTTTEGNCNPQYEPDEECTQIPPPYFRQYIQCSQICQ